MVDAVDENVQGRHEQRDSESGLGIHSAIARLAVDLHGVESRGIDQSEVLAEVTRAAVTLLPGVDHAGVTLVSRRRGVRDPHLATTAQTSGIAERFDMLQTAHGQGPCFEAVWEHSTIESPDLHEESRWRDFVEAVTGSLPVRSSLSIQLYVSDTDMGALNLYSETTHAFDDDARELAHILATHAAVAISGARRSEQFRSALASRDVIGQAKGMLMERFDTDAVHAFDLLRRLSQDTNTRLVEVAEKLVWADHPPAELAQE